MSDASTPPTFFPRSTETLAEVQHLPEFEAVRQRFVGSFFESQAHARTHQARQAVSEALGACRLLDNPAFIQRVASAMTDVMPESAVMHDKAGPPATTATDDTPPEALAVPPVLE